MTLDDFALMVAKDILIFKWMFVPETRSIRIWTCTRKDGKEIDVRDITEDELYGRVSMKKILEEYTKERPKTMEGIRKAQKECALYPVKEIE